MKAPDILKAAAGHMEERAATYDKPEGERSMAATVSAFRCVTGHSLTEEQGWLFMQLLKAVRSQQGDYRADSYEDGAAYASLAGEAAYRERVQIADRYADTHLDLRMDTIARNGNDGEHYPHMAYIKDFGTPLPIPTPDMTDPANWRAGDLVTAKGSVKGQFTKGNQYRLRDDVCCGKYQSVRVEMDDGGREYNGWGADNFRFHSRPSQVNENDMSGAWIVWNGGECPCDELSMVEVEYRDGMRSDIPTPAGKYRWSNCNNPSDIIRYRML